MSGRLDFEFGFNNNSAQPIDDKIAMRMYFLADFSGHTANAEPTKIAKIDVDNFDDVMIKLAPTITLGSGHVIEFNELESFHPDELIEHAVFKNLRRLKRDLKNSATANGAAQEIMKTYQLSEPTSTNIEQDDNTAADNSAPQENNDDLLTRLLGQKQTEAMPTQTQTQAVPSAKQQALRLDNLDQFIGKILSPHIIKNAQPEHQNLLVFLDTAIEELMNSILHEPAFQRLEAAWRSVREVLFNEEYDEACQQFYLVNTKSETLTQACAGDPLFATQLAAHIKNTDTKNKDVLVADHVFKDNDACITELNYLASLADTLDCQLLSAADDTIVNANEASLWQQFRQTPQAKKVALSYPKVLLRIPYGKKHDEIDSFAYEEIRKGLSESDLLWGNSAFACARLYVRDHHKHIHTAQIDEMPAFVYDKHGEQVLHPCAQYLFSESQLNQIRQQGLLAFISFRNKDAIRLFGDKITAVNV